MSEDPDDIFAKVAGDYRAQRERRERFERIEYGIRTSNVLPLREAEVSPEDEGRFAPVAPDRDEGRPGAAATQLREPTAEEIAQIPPAAFRAWSETDLAAIPAPEFVYADQYALGYTSVTSAPPKLAKSMLALAESIDMATGRGILTERQRSPLRVLYFNAEDDQDVINGRIAALLTHYRIPQEEIIGRLFAVSGVGMEDFYLIAGQEGVINERQFVALEKFCAAERVNVLIFDPLQDLSRSPETNEVYRLLGRRLRRFAHSANVAVGIIHHTRKLAPGQTPSMDDMRGGGALRGTSRFNRILVGMTEDEAAKAGVPNHRYFFRIADSESNLAPPSATVNHWFEKVSVLTPNGHQVGAVAPWSWPDAFAGVSNDLASAARRAVLARDEPPRQNSQASDWVGHIVGKVLDIDTAEKSGKVRVAAIVKAWIETDVLRVTKVPSKRDGREVPAVVAGDNDPAEGDQ